jgi:hypothetical protein
MGRFMSPDPFLNSGYPNDPQTWNRYTYALNNPVKIVDPNGLYNLSAGCLQDATCAANAKLLKDGLAALNKALDDPKVAGALGELGVQRIEDPHHPRGYRELRSNAEMRRLVNRKVVEQDRECALCHVKFTHYNDIVPDHINPRGMGGAWRDDHPDNIQALHWWCNGEKGSSRV